MGILTDKLVAEMDELSRLLENVGENRWGNRVREARSFLSASNYQGIEAAKAWFGTVGTLNDLVIHPINGHKVSKENLEQVNSKVRELSSNILNLVRDIERNTNFE